MCFQLCLKQSQKYKLEPLQYKDLEDAGAIQIDFISEMSTDILESQKRPDLQHIKKVDIIGKIYMVDKINIVDTVDIVDKVYKSC